MSIHCHSALHYRSKVPTKDLFSLVLSCYTNPMKGSRDRPSQYFWHDPDPSSYTPRTISRILGNNRVRKPQNTLGYNRSV